jgi:branched-chain amino acid transport system ATP-binding protein
MTVLLEVAGLAGGYPGVRVFEGVRLSVSSGEILTIVGANGSGKSALLQTLQGFLQPHAGTIRFQERPVQHLPAEARAAAGIILVSDRRWLWPDLSVSDHVRLGAFRRSARPQWRARARALRQLFPTLWERPGLRPARLSGGLQQQLTLARFGMAKPSLWLLDDPLQGLDDATRARVIGWIRSAAADGAGVIATGQTIRALLELGHRAMLLEQGRLHPVAIDGDALRDPRVLNLL